MQDSSDPFRTAPVPDDLKTFSDFWPYYVRDHLNWTNQVLHVIGTSISLYLLYYFIHESLWYLIWLPFVTGYTFAWVGHFLFERNRPTTYKYPWFSLRGDIRFWHRFLLGKMPSEIRKARIKLAAPSKL
jgi:hypothetical protein